MFWHLRMILAYKKTLGKFTKVLGFEKTLPPPLGKIPKKSRFFFGQRPLGKNIHPESRIPKKMVIEGKHQPKITKIMHFGKSEVFTTK